MHNASRSEHANFLRAAQGCCDDIKIRLGLRVALGGGGFCRSRGCRQVRIRHGCGRMCRRWQCRHSRSLRRRPRERARGNRKKPHGAKLMSLRKDSRDTGMGCIGSCAPLCCGVRGRSPASTAARSCCCALSAPRTSSRLCISRELPLWWPWASLSGPRMLGTSSI